MNTHIKTPRFVIGYIMNRTRGFNSKFLLIFTKTSVIIILSKILRKEVVFMKILPVSDLRDYNKVLSEVSYGSEVVLTKNGKTKYAIIEIEELQRMRAERWLMEELRKTELEITEGRVSTLEDVRKEFGLCE